MRLGGFVIHGNARQTLAACVDSLKAVCDEVVAVDSHSDDGSAELLDASGVRRIVHSWEGYGAARAVAGGTPAYCE
jgi:glycosyltransferase involved in cell wall biosynthesis